MTLQQFITAALGAIVGAFLARRTERYKQLQGLRAAAYVDFLRGISKLAIVQKDEVRDEERFREQREAMMTVADARARIAIYGSKKVVHSLSAFIIDGAVLDTSERLHSFARLCELMRNESTSFTQHVPFEDVHKLLFS